jgi:hypothetical protein
MEDGGWRMEDGGSLKSQIQTVNYLMPLAVTQLSTFLITKYRGLGHLRSKKPDRLF